MSTTRNLVQRAQRSTNRVSRKTNFDPGRRRSKFGVSPVVLMLMMIAGLLSVSPANAPNTLGTRSTIRRCTRSPIS